MWFGLEAGVHNIGSCIKRSQHQGGGEPLLCRLSTECKVGSWALCCQEDYVVGQVDTWMMWPGWRGKPGASETASATQTSFCKPVSVESRRRLASFLSLAALGIATQPLRASVCHLNWSVAPSHRTVMYLSHNQHEVQWPWSSTLSTCLLSLPSGISWL